jgi:zinc/manganese transport system substrate-binding protein
VVLSVVLAGCTPATPADTASDGVLRVVASTNVYGDLAASVGGADVEVTSIIEDPAQDPHEFEANARVQLALSRADVVIQNGGGYDDFVGTMLSAAENADATVLDAVEVSGLDASVDGFNEHVFYDYPAMQKLVVAIADALSAVDPDHAAEFATNAATLTSGLDALIAREAGIAATAAGSGVVITEPVPLYLLDAIGLENLTPPEFSAAIEADTDIPPALLQKVLNALGDGSTALVVYNTQTGGPQTDAVLDIASENDVPVVGVTETLPAGDDYLGWQGGVLDDIAGALAG